MRLLQLQDSGSFSLVEFLGNNIPPYAILSHTWGREEVTYQDLLDKNGQGKEGYCKLIFCAEQSAKDDIKYFWIDTCCIDKSSSAELSEAITSMFRWYRDSAQCYVFLSDVSFQKRKAEYDTSEIPWESSFRTSRWFTRGWTLQELIAPYVVRFFSRDGKELGNKSNLKKLIHEITHIPVRALENLPLHRFSVEERMSWAKARQTTREEDEAYSLLGVFGISMPALYGEGRDLALKRLQKEIKEHPGLASIMISRGANSEKISREERLGRIHKWLSAPDPSTNFHAALKLREQDTGLWFMDGEQYARWKADANSILWLNGIPGCGKTILSSSIVDDLLQMCERHSGYAVIYFYFDFNEVQKQHAGPMLRALICQLSRQAFDVPTSLEIFFSSHENGSRQPSLQSLLQVLYSIIAQFSRVYIMLDALDECAKREELMEMIETIAGWHAPNMHMMLTSRRERDIECSMNTFVPPQNMVSLQATAVDKDIAQYVRHRLADDKKLAKWGKDVALREEIETTLMKGSEGMFRWAACQLDTLRKCRNRSMLRKALVTLPRTLDETYSRILCAISDEDVAYAMRILQWLAFSIRPLLMSELREAIAIDTTRDPAFEADEVLEDPEEILDICSGLITVTKTDHPKDPFELADVIVLAHFSVKEYLMSDRIKEGSAARYSMQEAQSHATLATSCLEYLLPTLQRDSAESNDSIELISYSTQYWMDHTCRTQVKTSRLEELAANLMSEERVYCKWASSYLHHGIMRNPTQLLNPLYHAACAGLDRVMDILLAKGFSMEEIDKFKDPPLLSAAMDVEPDAAKLLLKKGAAVNASDTRNRYALTIACNLGREEIVRVLLDAGADVHVREGKGSSATTGLQFAAAAGYEAIVKMLTESRSVIPLSSETTETISSFPSSLGSLKTYTSPPTLDSGCDISDKDDISTALQAASDGGHVKIVKFLLDAGADINSESPKYGTALQAASRRGHESIVAMLLRKGADVNPDCHYHDSPLTLACRGQHRGIMSLLLKYGAVKARDKASAEILRRAFNLGPTSLSCISSAGHSSNIWLPDQLHEGSTKAVCHDW